MCTQFLGSSGPFFIGHQAYPRSSGQCSKILGITVNGRFYWVATYAMPLPDGQLSALTNTPALGHAELCNRSALRPRLRPPAKP